MWRDFCTIADMFRCFLALKRSQSTDILFLFKWVAFKVNKVKLLLMGNMKQVTQKWLQITLCSCKSCIAKSIFMAVLKSFHYNTNTNLKKNTGTMHLNLFPWHRCFAMPLKLLLKLFWYQRLFVEGAQRPTRELKKKDAEERVTGCLCGRIDVKWERGWPSQVNRLWAVSHSWHAHNYSISSTINGNSLKQHRELKQTPSLYSSNPPSTHHPLYPITSES